MNKKALRKILKAEGLVATVKSASEGEFMDKKMARAWKKALTPLFAWKSEGERRNSRIYQMLRRNPTDEDANSQMLELIGQYRKEGKKLLKATEAFYAAAADNPLSERSDFRQGKRNLDDAKYSLTNFSPTKYDNPVDLMYHGTMMYQMLMGAIEHLAWARNGAGLPQSP